MKMKLPINFAFIVSFITLQVTAHKSVKHIIMDDLSLSKTDSLITTTIKTQQKPTIITKSTQQTSFPSLTKTSNRMSSSIIAVESVTTSTSFPPSLSVLASTSLTETIRDSTASPLSSSLGMSTFSLNATTPTPTRDTAAPSNQYCSPSLCEFYNGSHTYVKPHIACKNSGNFGPACGSRPHLLQMSERRRNLILDLHNRARSRIASGQVVNYESASHMPQLKWDNELEYLATLHVKRCRFEHDLCHNTLRFPYSGQNIGHFWKGANITSHSKRMKNLIVNWYQERKDANQSFIDSFHLHPDNKAIGHFATMVGDRVHHIGCAVIRFYDRNLTQILMTCNYDYNNFLYEPVFQTGPTASKCVFKESDKYPGLCDWKVPNYEYEAKDDDAENGYNLIYRI